MPRRTHIGDFIKGQLLTLHKAGLSNRQVARRLSISEHSVRYNISKYLETGSMAERDRPGRPRMTTWRDDLLIKKEATRKRTANLRELANKLACVNGTRVSARTISRRLAENGLHRRVAKRKPWLSERHRNARLQWAKDHAHFTSADWEKVLWTDESKFTLFDSSRRKVYVSRRKGEEYRPECLRPTVKFGGKSVMVWGCFSAKGVGELRQVHGIMNCETYLHLVRDAGLHSASKLVGSDFVYQQDNDPKHTAKAVKAFFATSAVRVMHWPSQSPDLNPIEHLWDDLDRRLRAEPCQPTSAESLFAKLQALWHSTAAETTRALVASMPRRLLEVIKNKGGATSF